MAKKKSKQHQAISAAWKKPERRWFASKRMAYGPGFWTNYNEVSVGWGKPPYKYHGESVPEGAWLIWFRLWTPRLMVWKHLRRII